MKHRSSHGLAILFLMIVSLSVIVAVSLAVVTLQMEAYRRERANQAVQAASLAAASAMSRIVIEDPYWGYVSLSDRPANGRATTAGDGQPLPVTGINTIMITARTEALLAELLNSDDMRALAHQDWQAAQAATQRLQGVLIRSLDQSVKSRARDYNGQVVSPVKCAQDVLVRNLGKSSNIELEAVQLTCGWLAESSSTTTLLDKDLLLQGITPKQLIGARYKSFVNYPVSSNNYTFAGVSDQSSLVVGKVNPPDKQHICSIINVAAKLKLTPPVSTDLQITPAQVFWSRAAAMPMAMPDYQSPGTLALHFPHGIPPGLTCLRSLVQHPRLRCHRTQQLAAKGGDYPDDTDATLATTANDVFGTNPTQSQVICTGVRDWVRGLHGKVKLESLMSAMDEPFQPRSAQTQDSIHAARLVLISCNREGNVTCRHLQDGVFLKKTVTESQLTTTDYNAYESDGIAWTIIVRDHVHALGVGAGGKHGGQPVTDELPLEYADMHKREAIASGCPSDCRPSFLAGGLSAAIEISAPTRVATTAAQLQ